MAKMGRNDQCSCGSGKKYKRCCLGKVEESPPPAPEPSLDSDEPWIESDVGELDEDDDWLDLEPESAGPVWSEAWGRESERGYALQRDDAPDVEVAAVWWALWREVVETFSVEGELQPAPSGLKLHAYHSTREWCMDLGTQLSMAAEHDATHLEHVRTLAREFGVLFPEVPLGAMVALRVEVATAVSISEGLEAADAEYEALVQEYPDEPLVYATWGDLYAGDVTSGVSPVDIERAEAIYRRGLGVHGASGLKFRTALNELAAYRMAGRSALPRHQKDPDIAELMRCSERLSKELVARIVARGGEVVPLLNELMLDAEGLVVEHDFKPKDSGLQMTDDEAEGAGWAPCHAAFLAAAIGDLSSLGPLLHVGAADFENEYLHNGFAWFPSAFGPEAVESFLGFVLDRRVYWYHRAQAAKGVVWAAGQHPELRSRVASALAEAIGSGAHDPEMTTWLAVAAARTGEPSVLEAIRQAAARGAIDTGVTGDLDGLLSEPADWFLKKPPLYDTTETYVEALRHHARRSTNSYTPSGYHGGKASAGSKAARKAQRKARKKSKGKRR